MDLHREAVYRFGLHPETDPIRFIPVGQVRQGTSVRHEVILLGTDKDTIQRQIDLLELAALVPVGLDPLPCALFRGLDRTVPQASDNPTTILYLDIGHHSSTVVFGRQRELRFIKSMTAGEIARALGVDPKDARVLRTQLRQHLKGQQAAESQALAGAFDPSLVPLLADCIASVVDTLAHRISWCLRYYSVTFRGEPVDRVIVSGGGANEPLLLEGLRRHLPYPLERAVPFTGLAWGGRPRQAIPSSESCEWAAAVGAACKGVGIQQADEDPLPSDVPESSRVAGRV